ncbi:MAG: hypothetical protein LPK07_12545, partial [Hymenobacteraceae bacterium]|nr:hypothetical protein [Hymenobacteraceae bacterium]
MAVTRATHSPPATASMNASAIEALLQKQRNFFNAGRTLDVSFRKERLRDLQQAIKRHEQELFDAMYT